MMTEEFYKPIKLNMYSLSVNYFKMFVLAITNTKLNIND